MPIVLKLILLLYLAAIVLVHTIPFTNGISLSAIDVAEVSGLEVRASDLVHVFVFLPWGFLGFWYLSRRAEGYMRGAVLWTLLGIVVGISAEGIQFWIAYRSFSLSDMGFNIGGVLLGSWVFALRCFVRKREMRPRSAKSERSVAKV